MIYLFSSPLYYTLSLAIFLADRITKSLALSCTQPYTINDFLSFELMINRGVSWSMFHSDNNLIFGLVTLVVVGIALSLAYYAYMRYSSGHTIAGELLIFAGASSNIVDRCVYHGVIDFIVLTFGTWTFPVFNIADVSIMSGVILMLWTHARDL